MRQSKLKAIGNKQFYMAENVMGGLFLNHSTVLFTNNTILKKQSFVRSVFLVHLVVRR